MKRIETIKSSRDFTNLIETSKYIKGNDYIIYYKDNNLNKKRFGIAVSSKLGNAVTRNKLKRQTREVVDSLKTLFKNNKDYIIMIRKGCLTSSFENKKDSMKKMLEENKYE